VTVTPAYSIMVAIIGIVNLPAAAPCISVAAFLIVIVVNQPFFLFGETSFAVSTLSPSCITLV